MEFGHQETGLAQPCIEHAAFCRRLAAVPTERNCRMLYRRMAPRVTPAVSAAGASLLRSTVVTYSFPQGYRIAGPAGATLYGVPPYWSLVAAWLWVLRRNPTPPGPAEG